MKVEVTGVFEIDSMNVEVIMDHNLKVKEVIVNENNPVLEDIDSMIERVETVKSGVYDGNFKDKIDIAKVVCFGHRFLFFGFFFLGFYRARNNMDWTFSSNLQELIKAPKKARDIVQKVMKKIEEFENGE